MTRSRILLLAFTLALCLSIVPARTVSARGLLGERYANLQFGITRPGNSAARAIDDSAVGVGAGLNWPVNDSVDLNFAFAHQEFAGRSVWGSYRDIETNSLIGGANLLVSPGEQTCPFLAGRFGLVHSNGSNDIDPLVALGGGVQFDLTDSAAVTPSLIFHHVDETDDLVLSLDGNLWIAEDLVALGGVGVGFDEGDLLFTLGVGLAF